MMRPAYHGKSFLFLIIANASDELLSIKFIDVSSPASLVQAS
jgi:hypothetical protein